MPTGIAHTLSLAETGAFFRLAAFSWRQEPPCSLPDAPSALADVAGVALDNWPRLTRLVGAITVKGADGRLHLPDLRRAFDAALARAERARRRTAPATEAAAARRRSDRRHEHPLRTIRDGPSVTDSVTDPLRMVAAFSGTRARAERSALQRSSPEIAQRSPGAQSALSASSADVIAQIGSAGARALATESLRRWQHAQALRMFSAAIQQWRDAGLIDGRVPLRMASDLAACEHASPARSAAAIEAVRDAIARSECRSAVGMLIGLVGAVRPPRTPRPMDVPLPVQRRWDDMEAAYLREQAAAIATAAAIAERRSNTGGGPISAAGA